MKEPTLKTVKKEICFYFNITESELNKGIKKRYYVDKRHIFLNFCYQYVDESINVIAEYIGYDHAIIYHAEKRSKNEYDLQELYIRFYDYMTGLYDLEKVKRKKGAYNYTVAPSKRRYRKPVDCYTLDMKFIKSYKSVQEASRELNICTNSIYKACKGFYKRAGYFKFKYTEI
jgi:hypothetical protein